MKIYIQKILAFSLNEYIKNNKYKYLNYLSSLRNLSTA